MTSGELLHMPEDGFNPDWFKQQSLIALRELLALGRYPGYPEQRFADSSFNAETHSLPEGPWHIAGDVAPPSSPTHPWLHEMVTDPAIGVVTGRGFFWEWGPNETADAIVVRRDLLEPYVLLITRGDTGHLALPGGFKNKSEADLDAAIREAGEESGILLDQLTHRVKPVYKGPLADLRATAHAWPETAAFCFELALVRRQDQKRLAEMMSANRRQLLLRTLGRIAFKERLGLWPWEGLDDARRAQWMPSSRIKDCVLGSHRLLIDMALNG